MSLGRINYVLRALINIGFVKVNNFKQSQSKLGYVYLLTPSGIKEKSALTKLFLVRKMKEFDTLKREIEALQQEIGESDLSKVEKGY